MNFGTVCIIGPGLIGGSIGLCLKKRNLASKIIGVCHRTSSIEKAVKMQAIDAGFLNANEAVKDADIVILATSVDKIIDLSKEVIPAMKRNSILTDVGSTKALIVKQITNNIRKDIVFVGAHPIAGLEQRGIEFALPDLFEGCTCIITPLKNNTKAVETISTMWQLMGARVKFMSPEQHDEILASVSHLPHLVASCLINSIEKEHISYVASGLRDTTRIASGDPELWANIFDQNRDNVIKSIEQLIAEVNKFKNDLINKDVTALLDKLKKAKLIRDSVFNNNSKDLNKK
ncbi:MAG TPA: prephenate dehydrogenase [Candidatus Wujingus californicus]|uniref:prephenate dehydrogenase n=1 Tax=Candidatus Wujingus californicus TaxID=3367618 RepID=UPI001D368310|nr:prephenate dehydrogenase/arogenate dehydrogenase family protein [Planctomycetota bacterium]MDO8131360.1 prephenate dehydrogenase/arogenate dehydrogenase family protein [Candidatus Brocadiales bacterium]